MAKQKTLEDHLEDWRYHNNVHIKKKTATAYYGHVRRFLEVAGIKTPDEITRMLIQPYIDRCSVKYKPTSVRIIRFGILSFCEYLVDFEILTKNPCKSVKSPKIYLEPIVFLTEDEIRRVLILGIFFGIGFEIKFALATGLRCDEMKNLLWENVHLKEKFLEVRKGKNGKNRTVPIMDSILEDLEVLTQPSGYVFPGRYQGSVRSTGFWYFKLAKLQKRMPKIYGWHIFRHTFASLLAQQGVAIEKISKWLGHVKLQTTLDYYANVCPNNYDEAINQFPGLQITVPDDNWNNLKCETKPKPLGSIIDRITTENAASQLSL